MATPVPVALVQQAMTDHGALEELMQQFNGFVLSLARTRGVDAATADDVSQEVWAIVERELPKLREPKAFLGWLARITENATTAAQKRGTREGVIRKGLSERMTATTEQASDVPVMLEESHLAVIQALRSLPEDYRIPVIMRFYQGMTAREIADVLDCPLGTILSRLFRANAMLRDRLRKHFE